MPAQLGIDEALSLALDLHKNAFFARARADLDRARTLYEKILAAVPDHPDALHYLGVLIHQTGEPKRALELIHAAIAARPDQPDMYNNLGNILKEQGQPLEAAAAYRAAIELGKEGADAQSNLGVALNAAGQLDAAMTAFERAIVLDPHHAGAHHNLGNALVRVRRIAAAVPHFEHAIAVDPLLSPARQSLALALHHAGRTTDAVAALREWEALEPSHPTAVHLLAAISQTDVPGRASDDFVRAAFDALAPSFDEHLRELGYRAPELVVAALSNVVGVATAGLDVLDAGCGTGLCGAMLRPYARKLIGVDLSSGMLAKARTTGYYDELVEAELTAFLGSIPSAYDVIASADTLCYFGGLGEIADAVARALRSGGVFAFTVEREASGTDGFRLHAHGRYSHTEGYVHETAARAGLVVQSLEIVTLRMERGEPVAGLLAVVLRA